MSRGGPWYEPWVEAAGEAVSDEVGYWRDRATAPWRDGRRGSAAAVGRWIGFGLAVAATVAGVAAALRAERPWDR